MKNKPMPDKVAGCTAFLARAGLVKEPLDDAMKAKLEHVIRASGDRIKLFSDILMYGAPFFRADPQYDPKAVEKQLKKAGAADLLRDFAKRLATAEPFDAPTLDKLLHEYIAEKGLKAGDLVHPVRIAITGGGVGLGLFDALEILGRTEVLRRIELALQQ